MKLPDNVDPVRLRWDDEKAVKAFKKDMKARGCVSANILLKFGIKAADLRKAALKGEIPAVYVYSGAKRFYYDQKAALKLFGKDVEGK